MTACRSVLLASLTLGVPTHGFVRPPAAALARVLAEARLKATVAKDVGFSTWAPGPEGAEYIMSPVERARTVAQAMKSATFCTACKNQDGAPFGSHVDYILDEKGWPVLLLSDQALHTKNVEALPTASLYAQLTADSGGIKASMPRVTIMGTMVPVQDQDELFSFRSAYSVAHSYATQLVESDKFKFVKLKPTRIFYAGGFGVNAEWVDVEQYETAVADPLALESLALVKRINNEQRGDLATLCQQFIPGLASVLDLEVTVTTIDRLGMDIRVTTDQGARTDEYRVGFLVKVRTLEEAKSEIVKIFQEAWEKEQGEYWEDMGPPIIKTQVDILDRK